MLLKYKDSVVLVGGGPLDADVFTLVRDRAGFFVAADSGADALLARGVIPDAVIGDMDSLSKAGRAAVPQDRLVVVDEQDSTDFEKAAQRIEAPLIYALGFTGARLDHELAALHVLVRYANQPIVMVGEVDVTVHLPARIELDLPKGLRVSLFPFAAVRVGMEGLRWSFEAIDLHPMHRIGTSNEVSGNEVSGNDVSGGRVLLTSDCPGAVLILPREALGAVIKGLACADLHSPQG